MSPAVEPAEKIFAREYADLIGRYQDGGQGRVEMGGEVRVVPPQYTSQTCPACGHVAAENRPTQSKFCCVIKAALV